VQVAVAQPSSLDDEEYSSLGKCYIIGPLLVLVTHLFHSATARLVEFFMGRPDVECLECSDSISQCEVRLWHADVDSGNRYLCAVGHYEVRMTMAAQRALRDKQKSLFGVERL